MADITISFLDLRELSLAQIRQCTDKVLEAVEINGVIEMNRREIADIRESISGLNLCMEMDSLKPEALACLVDAKNKYFQKILRIESVISCEQRCIDKLKAHIEKIKHGTVALE